MNERDWEKRAREEDMPDCPLAPLTREQVLEKALLAVRDEISKGEHRNWLRDFILPALAWKPGDATP